ncbi:hypothetical protein GJ496_007739 [Pomphorhynchus laevis]|nr:hypothetical protein GJ496_007739 [Pomphorhynchus laevis]
MTEEMMIIYSVVGSFVFVGTILLLVVFCLIVYKNRVNKDDIEHNSSLSQRKRDVGIGNPRTDSLGKTDDSIATQISTIHERTDLDQYKTNENRDVTNDALDTRKNYSTSSSNNSIPHIEIASNCPFISLAKGKQYISESINDDKQKSKLNDTSLNVIDKDKNLNDIKEGCIQMGEREHIVVDKNMMDDRGAVDNTNNVGDSQMKNN